MATSAFGTRVLPGDWYSRFGQEVAETLFLVNREGLSLYRDACLAHAWQDAPYRLESTSICPPIGSENALHFYNNPAICYMLKQPWNPDDYQWLGPRHRRPIVFTQHSYIWLRDAFKHWESGTQYNACDGKGIFHTVMLDGDEFSSFGDWVGLGVKSSLDSEEAIQLREKDLAALVMQHQHLCDLVYERSHRPCDFEGEGMPASMQMPEWSGVDPVMNPVCRAVLLIATCDMTIEKGILIVLTGDNGALMGPAPGFDSIPEERIVKHLGENVVEVSLKTAANFLRHLDSEEERFNDVLRNITKTRIQKVEKMIHEDAVKEVAKWNKRGDREINANTRHGFPKAIVEVLDNHGE